MIDKDPIYTSELTYYKAQHDELEEKYRALQRAYLELLTDYNRLVSNTVVAYESIRLEPSK
jgi:hypothetical protein